VDGFFGGEPWPQRAVFEGVGFIHLMSKEIWDGHGPEVVEGEPEWPLHHPLSGAHRLSMQLAEVRLAAFGDGTNEMMLGRIGCSLAKDYDPVVSKHEG
jgi:hypothetical protein